MLKTLLIVFALTFIAGRINATSAQTEKRIQFEKGQTSAKIEGTTGENGVTYVVGAKGGQKLVLDLTSTARVGIKVETEGSYGHMVLLREEKAGSYEVGLEENGDYTIFIGSINHTSVPFTLTVKIAKLADI